MSEAPKTPEPLTEVFVFYRDGWLHHIHTNRSVFEKWMKEAAWQYPPDRCEIVRFIPAPHMDDVGEVK